jgi:hypothetical protein
MKAKEIYQTIKEKPYRDGEALIKKYAADVLIWNETIESGNNPHYSGDWALALIEKFESPPSQFYCDNRVEEMMLPCGEQCDTCKNYTIKDNKIELLEEDITCVHKYLDTLHLPRTDDKGETYSIVGRIFILQRILQEEIDTK